MKNYTDDNQKEPKRPEKYIREWDSASCLINIHRGFWQKQFKLLIGQNT